MLTRNNVLVLMTVALSMMACSAQPDGASGGSDGVASSSEALITLSGPPVYDTGATRTLRAVSGPTGTFTFHTCPANMAMIGAHYTLDIWKCAALAMSGTEFYSHTARIVMGANALACPVGAVMTGYHHDAGYVACRWPIGSPLNEIFDRISVDLSPEAHRMRTCGSTSDGDVGTRAMSGINLSLSGFFCAGAGI